MEELKYSQRRGRPQKYRIIRHDLKVAHFSPRGRPGRPDEVQLSMDELEAVRLADFMGLSQKEAANSMRISQQTFSRVLKSARKKISTVLVMGARMKIQGGYYVISSKE